VAATGSYHTTRAPAWATSISDRVLQLHSHDYRNQAALPHGDVLVVGSGQTGLQLAEELFEAGRRVYISVGSAGRIPRRYRGRDIFAWLVEVVRDGVRHGVTLPTADQLPDPRRRFKPARERDLGLPQQTPAPLRSRDGTPIEFELINNTTTPAAA
jgi:putative flavoprotein involved in K+ transport